MFKDWSPEYSEVPRAALPDCDAVPVSLVRMHNQRIRATMRALRPMAVSNLGIAMPAASPPSHDAVHRDVSADPVPDMSVDELDTNTRTCIAFLDAIAADRELLDRLSAEDRGRLHQAVANVYHPDPVLRRQKMKAAEIGRAHV